MYGGIRIYSASFKVYCYPVIILTKLSLSCYYCAMYLKKIKLNGIIHNSRDNAVARSMPENARKRKEEVNGGERKTRVIEAAEGFPSSRSVCSRSIHRRVV